MNSNLLKVKLVRSNPWKLLQVTHTHTHTHTHTLHFLSSSGDQTDNATSNPQQENGSQTTPTGGTKEQEAEPGSKGEGNGGKQPEAKKAEAKKPKKPTVKSIDLPIAERTASLVKKRLDELREREVGFY